MLFEPLITDSQTIEDFASTLIYRLRNVTSAFYFWEGNRCVEGREVNFLMMLHAKRDLVFYVISACNSIKIPRFRKGKILFVNKNTLWFYQKVSETDIINWFEFIICYVWWTCIHTGTNCAPFITDLFFYSYEADFLHELFVCPCLSFH